MTNVFLVFRCFTLFKNELLAVQEHQFAKRVVAKSLWFCQIKKQPNNQSTVIS